MAEVTIKEDVSSKLYGWEHPDTMREYRKRNKSMMKKDKTTTLTEAVARGVKNGNYIVFGGMGSVRNPISAVHEIIRQKIGNLTIGAKGSQHDWHLLAAAGNVTKAEVAYGFADEVRGLSRPARTAVETGRLRVLSEITNAGFQWRFTAAMKGLSFYPTRSSLGTDTLHYSGSKTIVDPFTNEPVELLPACYPDVAIIHVHRADRYGNCQIDGNVTEDIEIAHAAKFVLITAEEIVHDDVITNDPALTKIPYFVVDAVVEAPYGSHPNQVPGLYSFDEDHWQIWLDASVSDETVAEYLDTYVYGSEDHYHYLEKIGGLRTLYQLEKIEKKLAPYPKVAKRRG
ncbi:CoA transferase subunit A [Bacillus sp. FJAT-29790]|uniref:CoA transferase subunit A n=1 Tax=Bacillus sp. FJAT-29790 TaxID=1895002 RepID=UPI001C23C955|nr:CoA-transferase [Bacillus sp. FJAT-29790]MBU8880348.1 CoA transferase subunit A [Bacillus sp. FJAT-29790]